VAPERLRYSSLTKCAASAFALRGSYGWCFSIVWYSRTSPVRPARIPIYRELRKLTAFKGSVVPLDIWINVESSIGIVCICLPSMRPLLTAMIPASWRAFFSRRVDGTQKSFTLTDQSNIRGRLRRIPSDATSNETLPPDVKMPFEPTPKDGFVAVTVKSSGEISENPSAIVPLNQSNRCCDIERPRWTGNYI
jgi:hypothetical protein